MGKTVTLYVPDLFNDIQQAGSFDKGLAWVLSKAKRQVGAALFSPTEHLSIAALLATFKGASKGSSYCLVSPIECYADQKTVYIINQALLSVEDENRMVATLNNFLQQDGIRLEIAAPGLWLFEMKHHTDVVMRDIEVVLGKSMDAQLPIGTDEVYWRRLLTECQMLLSQTLSVWFWGHGIDNINLHTSFDKVYTNSVLLKAKAYNAGIKFDDVPTMWTNNMLDKVNHLLLTPPPLLNELENQWLTPLIASLHAGVIHSLTLRLNEQTEYVLARRHCYYFWKKIKPLTAFITDGNRPIQ